MISCFSIWYVELTTSEMSWVSALINLGAMVGALVGGLLMDRLGRKTTLILMAVPAALGWALICLTVDPSKQIDETLLLKMIT